MIRKISTKFLNPFPYMRGILTEAKTTLIVWVLVVLIFNILNPNLYLLLDMSEITVFILLGFISVFLNLFIWFYIFKGFIDQEKWTVLKEITRTLSYVYVTAIILSYYISTVSLHIHISSIFQLVFYAILFAIIPVAVSVNSISIWLLKDRLKEAERLNYALNNSNDKIQNSIITLKSNIVKDFIETDSEQLVYIKAEQNYVNVFLLQNQELKQILLRLSLIKALTQIDDNQILQCHRSFIINLRFIENVTGNSQGLKLHLKNDFGTIPLSKTFIDEFDHYLIRN